MDTRLRCSIAMCSLLLLLAVVFTSAYATPINIRADRNVSDILSSPTPAVALGQWLSGSSNPDPFPSPATTTSTYPLTSKAQPVPLAADIKQTIMNKTIMYSGAAYCPSVEAGKWTCGLYCEANPDFVLSYSGGDGNFQQRFFVGWNPTSKEIVVARQGSNFSNFFTLLYDFDFRPTKLNAEATKVFSRLPNSTRADLPQIPVGPLGKPRLAPTGTSLADYAIVNMGFQTAWSRTYADIKKQVQAQLKAHPDAVRIFVTGYSLGAAIGTLDGIALRSVVPTSIQIEVSGLGQPRLGNPVFAALLDRLAQTPSENFVYHRVTHYADIVPHLFPQIMGYQHASNEVWIPRAHDVSTSSAVLCPGQENTNCADSLSGVANWIDHEGPYFGVTVGDCNTPTS